MKIDIEKNSVTKTVDVYLMSDNDYEIKRQSVYFAEEDKADEYIEKIYDSIIKMKKPTN